MPRMMAWLDQFEVGPDSNLIVQEDNTWLRVWSKRKKGKQDQDPESWNVSLLGA